MAITDAIYNYLRADLTLAALLASYGGQPAIFTADPVPGDAILPYIVTAGDVTNSPFDTKTTRGNQIWRDVRCYTSATGSAKAVEEIADRVRALLHRKWFSIAGYVWIWAECSGPIVADEQDAYGRVVTVKLTIEET